VKRIALILVVIAAMAIPAAAQAQSNGYGDVAGVNQGAAGSEGPAGTSAPVGSVATGGETTDSGVLPFTGLQLALIFGSGVVLLGSGLLLRRARSE
jgi:hypothetical protein